MVWIDGAEHWYRHGAGFHGSGSALDINTSLCPYIVTRSGGVAGGEAAGASLKQQRQAALDVYDRAVSSAAGAEAQADVGIRRAGEATGDVYDRFGQVSDALKSYLGKAFKADLRSINRPPVTDVENAADDDVLAAIPETERLDKDAAVAVLGDEALYFRILRDYELVRVPFVIGNPSASPASTRNPARGFVNIRREVVVSLCDVGKLRWGVCDFGAAQSGDVMHFDMNSNGSQNQFAPG